MINFGSLLQIGMEFWIVRACGGSMPMSDDYLSFSWAEERGGRRQPWSETSPPNYSHGIFNYFFSILFSHGFFFPKRFVIYFYCSFILCSSPSWLIKCSQILIDFINYYAYLNFFLTLCILVCSGEMPYLEWIVKSNDDHYEMNIDFQLLISVFAQTVCNLLFFNYFCPPPFWLKCS